MIVRCQKCGADWEVKGQIGVRDECPECAAYVHTCVACRHYDPGLKDCRLTTTEPVRDRAGQNFCEEFEYGREAAADRPAGPARPAEGPARPAEGPARPAEGPASPAEGPARPAEGPARPAPEASRSAEEARKRFEQLFRDPHA